VTQNHSTGGQVEFFCVFVVCVCVCVCAESLKKHGTDEDDEKLFLQFDLDQINNKLVFRRFAANKVLNKKAKTGPRTYVMEGTPDYVLGNIFKNVARTPLK